MSSSAGSGEKTAYVVFTSEDDQRTRAQEVVITPVRADDGSVLGWFFIGRDAETQVERSFQQAEKTSGRDGRSGLVAEGQWFVEGVSATEAEAISSRVSEEFWSEKKTELLEIDGHNLLMIAGCMGSTDRLNYTVLGDRVNLASRLCDAAGPGEVLVDQAIANALDHSIHAEPRDPIQLKGFAGPMNSFALRTLEVSP